jgi:hypothetical protein
MNKHVRKVKISIEDRYFNAEQDVFTESDFDQLSEYHAHDALIRLRDKGYLTQETVIFCEEGHQISSIFGLPDAEEYFQKCHSCPRSVNHRIVRFHPVEEKFDRKYEPLFIEGGRS